MTMTVKQLANAIDSVNAGKFQRVNVIDDNVWECNGLWIEKDFYGKEEYSVQYCGDYIIFRTFGDAVEFCTNAG